MGLYEFMYTACSATHVRNAPCRRTRRICESTYTYPLTHLRTYLPAYLPTYLPIYQVMFMFCFMFLFRYTHIPWGWKYLPQGYT